MSQKFTGTNLLTLRTGAMLAILFSLLLVATSAAQQPTTTAQMKVQVAQLPLAFEPNRGQAAERVKFLSRGPGYLLLLTKDEAVLALGGGKAGEQDVVRLQLAGAQRNPQAVGQDALGSKTNYFLGNDSRKWRTNIPNFGKVRYSQVYPGIDLLYYGKQNSLEHDFIVAPNADPSKIAMNVKGAKQLRVDGQGNLLLTTRLGRIQLDKPFIYQADAKGTRVEVAGGYTLNGNRVSFHVGPYDKSRELVIDPVLNYSTYFGGNGASTANAIAVNGTGNAYITGSTASSAGTLAGTALGAPDRDGTTKLDVFVAKLDAAGNALIFTTIIGGAGDEAGNAIAVDGNGDVYVTGQTSSTGFPTTAGAYATVGGANADVFVFKLLNSGASLDYSTYLPGSGTGDTAHGIGVTQNNHIVITGGTDSADFPITTATAFGATKSTGMDVFVTRINPAVAGATGLVYSTFIGSTGDETALALALTNSNASIAYITGKTTSAPYPVAGNNDDNTLGGTQDAFVTRIDTRSYRILQAECVRVSNAGFAEITTSGTHNFVSTDAVFINGVTELAGGADFDVNNGDYVVASHGITTTKFRVPDGSCDVGEGGTLAAVAADAHAKGTFLLSTHLGGNLVDEGRAIAVDGSNGGVGAAYVTGLTTSVTGFPNAANAVSLTGLNNNGAGTESDAFFAKLNSGNNQITYSAYLGGAGNDAGTAIVVNKGCTTTANCEAHVAGYTESATRFNINALQGALSGSRDGFVARVTAAGTGLTYATFFGGTGVDGITGLAANYVGTAGSTNSVYVAANTDATIGAAANFGGTTTLTSSAAKSAPDAGAASVIVAKLAGNNVASNNSLGIAGVRNVNPLGQDANASFTTDVTYTWTVTNSDPANAITLDIPTPQSLGGLDLLTILTAVPSAGSCSSKAGPGDNTGSGGVTCVIGDKAMNQNATVTVTARPTAAAHCANAPCTIPSFTITGKVASAETASLDSAVVTNNLAPVVNLVATGTAMTSVGGDNIYVQGSDNLVTYNIEVENQSNDAATIAADASTIDVMIQSAYPANLIITGVVLNGVPLCIDEITCNVALNVALAQDTESCFRDTSVLASPKLQCLVKEIIFGPANKATLAVSGELTPIPNNPNLANLITTSKYLANNGTEIFTETANNLDVPIIVNYSGPVADLAITAFTPSATTLRTGQNVTYTVSYDNLGTTDATQVTVKLTPAAPSPANTGLFTFVSNTPGDGAAITCTQPGGAGTVILCPIADADVAQAATVKTFTVTGTLTLDAALGSTLQNMTANISTTGSTSEPAVNVGPNTVGPVGSTFRREAALSVNTFSAPSTLADGVNLVYTFNVTNATADLAAHAAENTKVTFNLPQNLAAVVSITPGSCSEGTLAAPICNIGTVGVDVTVPVTLTVNPPDLAGGDPSEVFNGAISGIASASVVSTGGNKTALNIQTAIQRQTILSLSNLTDTPDPVASNGNITYTVDVTNDPASTGANTATNVKLDFTLSPGFTRVSPSAAICPAIAGGLRCNVPSVPTGAVPTTFTLVITPSPTLIPTNQATEVANASVAINLAQSTEIVDANGVTPIPNPNGTITTTVERRGDVQLFNLTATPTVHEDGNITVQAQVQNLSGVTATNVQVVFTFNHDYRFVSANVVNANGIPNTPAFACTASTSTTRTCTLPNLPISTLYTFNVVVQPQSGIVGTNSPAGNNTTVNVSATISASVVQSPNTGNDTSGPVATEVQRQANLRASGGGTAFTGPVAAINSSATATYNLTVRNDGPNTTNGAVVVFSFTNNVVASLTNNPAQWAGLGTCVRDNASQITCTMAAGYATGARTGSITITPDTATLLSGTNSATFDVAASISSANAYDNGTTGAPGPDNTTGTVTTTVQRQADLRVVSKTVPPAVADGGAISYTIVVQNFGPDTAGSVRLTDPLPSVTNGTVTAGATGGFTLNTAGATFVSPAFPGGATCAPNNVIATPPPVTVTCMLGQMTSGQQATITISGVANIDPLVSSASFNNVATVDAAQTAGEPIGGGVQTAFETNGGNNSNSVVSTTVSRSADLYMVDPVISTPVLIGGTPDPGGPSTAYVVGVHDAIKYDITVGNGAASSTDVNTASVQTTLPSTLTFSAVASPGCSAVAQVVTCPVVGTLVKNGPTVTVSFVAIPGATLPISGSNVALTITPSVSAAGNTDPNGSDNAANNTTTVNRVSDLGIVQTQPSLPISVTNSPTTATFVYTWTVTNNGPSRATGVVVNNTLPTDLKFESGSWPQVVGTPGTPAGNCTGSVAFGATITCNLSTIDKDAVVVITVTVRPTLTTSLANNLVGNQPSINGLVQDNVGGNNSSFTAIQLRGVTDLQTTITPVQDPAATLGEVLVGNNQTWAVTVTNNGPYPAGSVITLTDTLAPGVNLVGVSSTGFSCAGLTCTLSNLAVGASQTVNVTTTTPAGVVTGQTTPIPHSAVVTQYSNGTNVGGDVTDSNTGNNTGNSTVTGRAAANIGVTQVAPGTVVVGQSGLKFAVTVSNGAGRSDATNVVLTNTIAVDAPTSVSTTAFGTPSQGSCNAATGLGTASITIVCNLGTIAAGANATVDVSMTPTLGGFLANTPSVTATEVDPVPANNTALQASITVNTTPPGQQTFNPTDPGTGQPIPSVEISGFVVIPGNTTMVVNISNVDGLTLPANYRFGNAGAATNFYKISNTATFNNNGVTVCVKTPETFFQPHRARIFVLNPADDRTTSVGFSQFVAGGTLAAQRQVCGVVPSLPSGGATFVVMEPIGTVHNLDNVTVTVTGGGGKGTAGTSILLDGLLATDPDSFPCMSYAVLNANGTAVPGICTDTTLRVFRWVGNFLDVVAVDPATGLKVIVKNCRQDTSVTPFLDGLPCHQAQTSVGLGTQTITLTVIDENASLNPAVPTLLAVKTFNVGSTGAGGGATSQTISPGQTGTFTFTYTYGANTTFAFVGTPSLATGLITCTAQPLTYTGPVGGTQTSTVTVLCSTSAPVFGSNRPGSGNAEGTMVAGIVGITGLPLVGIILMPSRSRRTRKLRMLAMGLLITLMLVFTASCGGSSTGGGFGGAPQQLSAGTPKGDYSIAVNATPAPTAGGNPAATLTLKVQ